jgi:general nucleoside transport system ATP-binding protein
MIAPVRPHDAAQGALTLDTFRLGKRFGAFTALDEVTLKVRPGTVHALLGENGAGKSTLVKCVVGYQPPSAGSVLIDGREVDIASPTIARELGIGMVYQHFTVVPGMTVAENLLLARGTLPAVIRWREVRAELTAFLQTTPFRLDLDATPADLSAGEKQKLEILKQLYLKPRLLILDEPTSVLTPQEADEVLGALRERAHAGHCSIILITHKFREVSAYADDVTVLRRGRLVTTGEVARTTPERLAAAMIGAALDDPADAASADEGTAYTQSGGDNMIAAELQAEMAIAPVADSPAEAHAAANATTTAALPEPRPRGALRLAIRGLQVTGDRGEPAVQGLDLAVHAGEIVGIAGVSGNGQRELMESLVGQRPRGGGTVQVGGADFRATRRQNRALKVRSLPEEPLRNACVGALSVAQNMALRSFDATPYARGGLVRWALLRERARRWIGDYGVKTRGENAAISTLSGGNVQRAVLARELSDDAELLLVSNPVFGLDFAAVADIHARLRAARDRGAAVLLVSEDLDELLTLADRIVVMSGGRIVFDTPAAQADRQVLGRHMGGH